jgi:trigger factor
METVVETLNSYSKKLKVAIPPEDLIPLEEKVAKSYQKYSDIPGFRSGKAPLSIVRQRHRASINQEVLEEALRKFYGMALEETDIKPVAEGKITDFKFENIKSGMQFEIEVEVEPEIELKKYTGLKVEKDVVSVTDQMVDEALGELQEQYATVKEIDQALENHFVHFDAQELGEGDVPIVGRKYENLQAQLGSGKFDPEIEQQLLGVRKGEKRIVRKEIPPPPDKKNQMPEKQSLEIHVSKIEEKQFPELNDEFVKNLDDEKIQNLQQLRERIRQNMEWDFNQRSENIFQNRLIDELLKENSFEVPPSMVENYLNHMVENIKKQSKDKPVDEESVRKEYRAAAIRNIRWHFLEKKLMEKENINISEEEVLQLLNNSDLDEKLKNQARKDHHYLSHLREDMIERKVLDFLKEHAEITEVYPMNDRISVK